MSNNLRAGKTAAGKAEGLSMFDVVLLDRINKSGGREKYAARIGIAYNTLHGWLYGTRDPLHNSNSRRMIEADSSRSRDDLRRLQGVPATEGLDIVSEHIRNLDPVEQLKQQAETALHDRFIEVVKQRGAEIPGAAYVLYLTSEDMQSRQKLVGLLEGGETPPDMSVEALQFTIDHLPRLREQKK
jgi:hypothetical protein